MNGSNPEPGTPTLGSNRLIAGLGRKEFLSGLVTGGETSIFIEAHCRAYRLLRSE